MPMIGLPNRAPAMIATIILLSPSILQAASLGDSCRSGDVTSCKTLCSRGFKKACANTSGNGPGGGQAMVEFGEKSRKQINARGLIHTGLAPIYPQDAECEPGSPWENGYIESFNARFRDELLNGEIFYSLKEAQIINEQWRRHYNTRRPHSALGYKPPAPETFIPLHERIVMN